MMMPDIKDITRDDITDGNLYPVSGEAVHTALALKCDKSANLSDLGSAATARSNLSLGTSDTPTFSGLTITNKGTVHGLTIGKGGQTSVSSNTAFGVNALNSASLTGSSNVGIGISALIATTTGKENVCIGAFAMTSNTSGSDSVAIGRAVLQVNTTGSYNTGVGWATLFANIDGSNNTSNGYFSLRSNTSGSDNCGLGAESGFYCTSGSKNNFIGRKAGYNLTTGSKNIYIGFESYNSAVDVSNEIVIGSELTGKGAQTAYIGGTSGAYNAKNVTTWETTSDERIKKNISEAKGGLDVINLVKIRNFEYRTQDEITELPWHSAIESQGVQLGVIAQEFQKILPNSVNEQSTGVLSVSTDALLWHLVMAVQQLSTKVKELENGR